MMHALRAILDREPFVPFKIKTSGGEGYEVRDPDCVSLGKTVFNVFHPSSDKFAILRADRITSLETLDQA